MSHLLVCSQEACGIRGGAVLKPAAQGSIWIPRWETGPSKLELLPVPPQEVR